MPNIFIYFAVAHSDFEAEVTKNRRGGCNVEKQTGEILKKENYWLDTKFPRFANSAVFLLLYKKQPQLSSLGQLCFARKVRTAHAILRILI